MTIKQTVAFIRANYPKITCNWKSDTREYRVTFKTGTPLSKEDSASYCTDSDDAIGTARSMQVFCDENGYK